jgi:predicted glycoside hydrolase/deacetylase ChbG (UPF0249 family)
VLALAPGFERTVSWLLDAPALGTGAHLAAVGEDPPLLSAAEIPTLVDERGRLPSSWRVLLPKVAAGRIDPSDLRREFGAQIERIAAAGLTVDHLDTHQNVHLWPSIRDVVLDLGEAHGVRAIRVTRSTSSGVVGMTVRRLATSLERLCAARGWVFAAASTGLDEAGGLDLAGMASALSRLAATGAPSAELATHPGLRDDPDLERYRWGYTWGEEYDALRSPAVQALVGELGFTLGTFGDLARRSRPASGGPPDPPVGP